MYLVRGGYVHVRRGSLRFAVLLAMLFSILPTPVSARGYGDASEAVKRKLGIYFISNDGISTCTTGAIGEVAEPTGLDYAGKEIFTQGQLDAINKNKAVYEQAARPVDIPWQMLAVVHMRETGGKRSNPSNGQGIYQFVNKQGGPYPTGPVSEAEFLRQTVLAAEFLKSKAQANYSTNRNLSSQADPAVIKDTFFSYNGRASVYEAQAVSLGFGKNNQGFEGSPYVMNKADAKRDPATNPDGWGQIKVDGGGIEYPANSDYGAFVQYGALTGISGGTCSSNIGPVRQKVVQIAQAELALWKDGNSPSGGFRKYSQGRDENWCADFVSWVYNQAGYPLINSNEGNVPAVLGITAIGEKNDKFKYFGSSGYNPKPGDIAIHLGGPRDVSHVNIVVANNGKTITLIGGNQGGDGAQGDYFETSSVTKYSVSSPSADNIVGYVTPD